MRSGEDKWTVEKMGDLAEKLYLVTGGNTGLGFETARRLLQAGARVVITARDAQRGQAALARLREVGGDRVRLEELDLASLESVASLTERVLSEETHIDALVLNAGVALVPFGKTSDGFETHFAVNHLGHFALTLPLSRIVSRVVVTSSGGARDGAVPLPFEVLARREDDTTYDAMQVYCDSKLANLLFARALARRRPELEVVATHPGFTATDLQRHSFRFRLFRLLFAQSVEAGALNNVRTAVDSSLRTLKATEWVGAGGRGEMKGPPAVLATVPPYANDIGAQDTLWRISEQLTGICLPT
ncbi:MAG: SDR family NAD(P)-dependent oxidoreductase [Pseudohongiellaceae bacterium]